MAKKSITKEEFARRLTGRMRDKGFYAERAARSGVDVSVISKWLHVSGEMARRYCEGTAMPSPDRIRRLAEKLGVRSSWLQYGEGPMHPSQNDAGLDLDADVVELARRINSMRHRDRKVIASMIDVIDSTDLEEVRLRITNKK